MRKRFYGCINDYKLFLTLMGHNRLFCLSPPRARLSEPPPPPPNHPPHFFSFRFQASVCYLGPIPAIRVAQGCMEIPKSSRGGEVTAEYLPFSQNGRGELTYHLTYHPLSTQAPLSKRLRFCPDLLDVKWGHWVDPVESGSASRGCATSGQ